MRRNISVLGSLALLLVASAAFGEDGSRLISLDHYVRVKSTAPAIAGQVAQIYVREVVLAGTALRGGPAPDGVVLFVHGAGTPAEVTFDVPYKDYSWMAYLAKAGFDVFSMDMTGYGRSTRPPAMNDPCNFSKEQQAQFVPNADPGTVRAVSSYAHHNDGFGLERHRGGGRLPARAPPRGSGVARRLVARRPARRRLCGAESGEGGAVGCAGTCL